MNEVETFINSLRSTECILQELIKFMKTFKPAVSFYSWSPISANIHNKESDYFCLFMVTMLDPTCFNHLAIAFNIIKHEPIISHDIRSIWPFLVIKFLSFPLTNQVT